eukprot:jgi/Bigna1/140687/aug1.57_g15395
MDTNKRSGDDGDFVRIKIVHVSDTHGMHHGIKVPEGDVLFHTGDFSNEGEVEEEWPDFNDWLGKIRKRFRLGVYVILGNHDWKFLDSGRPAVSEKLVSILADEQKRRAWLNQRLPNATRVLDNEIIELEVTPPDSKGLKRESISLTGGPAATATISICACPWQPFNYSPTYPDRVPKEGENSGHRRVYDLYSKSFSNELDGFSGGEGAWCYENILRPDSKDAAAIDVLLSHVPPRGVFDRMPIIGSWGSSEFLRHCIMRREKAIRCHLFGHVHAQRGFWSLKEAEQRKRVLQGGVEYAKRTGDEQYVLEIMEASGLHFMANTALASDRTVNLFGKKRIAGTPRVINGIYKKGKWRFDANC